MDSQWESVVSDEVGRPGEVESLLLKEDDWEREQNLEREGTVDFFWETQIC